eukprot:scaffold395495_cov47-Attheya_sp.AAC.3
MRRDVSIGYEPIDYEIDTFVLLCSLTLTIKFACSLLAAAAFLTALSIFLPVYELDRPVDY